MQREIEFSCWMLAIIVTNSKLTLSWRHLFLILEPGHVRGSHQRCSGASRKFRVCSLETVDLGRSSATVVTGANRNAVVFFITRDQQSVWLTSNGMCWTVHQTVTSTAPHQQFSIDRFSSYSPVARFHVTFQTCFVPSRLICCVFLSLVTFNWSLPHSLYTTDSRSMQIDWRVWCLARGVTVGLITSHKLSASTIDCL